MNSWPKLPVVGSSFSFNPFSIKQFLIQRERKSFRDSYLADFSFKGFSFKARRSFFKLS